MNPIIMTLLLLAGWGVFAWSARRRWKLMRVGAPIDRFDRPGERLRATFRYGIAQLRMRRYPIAGMAHMLIFLGFGVLLLRTLILWGRGFDADFDFWFFGVDQPLGRLYSFLKDIFAVLVILGTLVFVYFRVIKRLPRMTLSGEGLVILGIILTMMVADILYDGATIARGAVAPPDGVVAVAPMRYGEAPSPKYTRTAFEDGAVRQEYLYDPASWTVKRAEYHAEPNSPLNRPAGVEFRWYEPAGSVAAMTVEGASDATLTFLMHAGFWTHGALVLIFLNLLPYSKHFHVITGIPNVYLQSLEPAGKLPNLEDIEGKLEREETLGIRRINQFSWKAILDFYTCTECGRCSDYCPATNTGKKLSPKHFTLDLRNFLYEHQNELVAAKASEPRSSGSGQDGVDLSQNESDKSDNNAEWNKDLIDGVIDPEVLWACTTCRACEQECPVFISYVDKIVDMRRYLVQERGEMPKELETAFRGMESAGNPWSFPAEDRGKWADGLDIPLLSDKPDAQVLFWSGCMPSFDERAKKVTRATAELMKHAGVDFAMLGTEEQCTGDPARRAGNEYLFQMFAQANVETLNNYGADKKLIVTSCPHCFNTLKNEYPDFGGKYEVVHHSQLLAKLVREGKIKPTHPVAQKVAYHDSCYMGRHNDEYDAPRDVLKSIPGLTVLEPVETRDRGMCCGAGGAQMFKEEEPGDQRVNDRRTDQLLETQPTAVASNCPFCMRMLTDGLAGKQREEVVQLDIAELLHQSVVARPAEATPSA